MRLLGFLDPMKLLISAAFGVSAMLLAFVVYQLLRAEQRGGTDTPRDPSQRRSERRRRAIEKSPVYALFLAFIRIPAGFIAGMEMERLRRYVRTPYRRAGYPGGMDDDEVLALAFVMALAAGGVIGFLLLAFFGPAWAIFGLLAMPAGFMAVVALLQNRGDTRQQQILIAMPYVLDLLVLVLRSGTSLNLALARVVSDYEEHPVGEELGQTLSEIEMGAPRAQAMRRMAERLGHPDMAALADSIVQSEELGWPLADTLARQAERMASERVLNAQAKAGAAGVWVMLPSTLVLLGAILLLFGPILVRVMRGGYNLK